MLEDPNVAKTNSTPKIVGDSERRPPWLGRSFKSDLRKKPSVSMAHRASHSTLVFGIMRRYTKFAALSSQSEKLEVLVSRVHEPER